MTGSHTDLVERVDFFRLDAARKVRADRKSDLGQFFTPPAIARLMASMLDCPQRVVRILDAGAGVGSLFSAAVAAICDRSNRPDTIQVTAYEVDPALADYILDVFRMCKAECERVGISFVGDLVVADFLRTVADLLSSQYFAKPEIFTCTLLNPPYKKISSQSEARQQLRRIGIETSNLYTGFLATAVKLLDSGGEMVAITPRSFCSGSYFRNFRRSFLRNMTLRQLHVFESRQDVFRDDKVLQENLVLHAIKGKEHGSVLISCRTGPEDDMPLRQRLDYDQVVPPDDSHCFIHIRADDVGHRVAERMATFQATLPQIGLDVSTGRVVDFRAREYLRPQNGPGTAPLIWPTHFSGGYIEWPKEGRKPNAILRDKRIEDQLIPSEPYVLVRRFSAKEEKRRVVAAVYDPRRIPCERVGFENHLNYFHRNGVGLDLPLAKGLAAFLNSTLVDTFFRQFSGHTQVNATDLRRLPYPNAERLRAVGARIGPVFPAQADLDDLIERECFTMVADRGQVDPVKAKRKIDQALEVLQALGLPRAQQNERSALTLLALLNLKPETPWKAATASLHGIRPMMDFFSESYGKRYAENTRETVRRQTVHQFLDAGLIVVNPDDPDRPTNSAKTVYRIEAGALQLLKTFGSRDWDKNLRAYLASAQTLAKKYARERKMRRIPLKLPTGKRITLSPGGQNVLVEKIITDFAEHFTPGGMPLYVGDTDEKFAYFDTDGLASLGVRIESHGKMPDVIIHYIERNWLVLIEAVTSHGPINPKRRDELKRLFSTAKPGLVFVTAFLNRKALLQYLGEISWETEVWVAESPTHLIHFNGERFLGPYPE